MVTILGGWLIVALVMSPLGYLRYLHMPIPMLRFLAVMLLPVALLCGAVFLLDSVLEARDAAARHQSLMRQGRLPGSFLGADPHFVRVHPLTEDPAYVGCRPATDRNLVSFGSTGERIYLWDPRTGQACQVRLGDYSFDQITARTD
jgi:hypothetical protein